MLRELQIAGGALDNLDYPVAEAAGLSIMSILADSCAGKTRARITDRGSAYAVITNLLVDDQKTFESGYETVVSITLRAMNLSNVPIDNLISFRKREEKWGGYSLRSLRHSYIDKIESHLKLLSTVNGNASDKEEIDRQFEDDMDNDLRHLRQELRIAKQDVVFSKDVISTIIAAAGTIAALYYGIPYQLPEVFTLAGAPVMVGGVFSSRNKYATSRKSILQKHPMAYLHELNEFH